jgi:hypothetical protein
VRLSDASLFYCDYSKSVIRKNEIQAFHRVKRLKRPETKSSKKFHQCRKLFRSYIRTFTSAGSFLEVILALSPVQEAF